VVYAAIDEQLDRRVAVKLMLADFDQEPDMRERFYREARITGQLAHRNIVTVFDLGEERNRPFIVMELLEGLPLAEHMQAGGSSSIDEKIDLMMQVCERDGSVKILDFGVARLTASNLTASGFLVGTPEYMSPEQPQGRPVDARSDVYSAASVFYFVLTGRSPFGSRDLLKMLDAILYESPAPLTAEEAPEALSRVLMKALSKAANDRQQHCAEVLADLASVRKGMQGNAQRVVMAARERYRDILMVIEERRALGRALRIPDIDRHCDADARRLKSRFPAFAPAGSGAPSDRIDRAVAQAALEALQLRHNAERAALAAMREQVAKPKTAGRPARPGAGMSRFVAFWRNRFGGHRRSNS
jgi:hypothetical protein